MIQTSVGRETAWLCPVCDDELLRIPDSELASLPPTSALTFETVVKDRMREQGAYIERRLEVVAMIHRCPTMLQRWRYRRLVAPYLHI